MKLRGDLAVTITSRDLPSCIAINLDVLTVGCTDTPTVITRNLHCVTTVKKENTLKIILINLPT